MYYCSLIYELCLDKHTCFFISTAMSWNLSASLKISLFYQAIYQYLLDNPVSGLSFVPTVIAALHPSNIFNLPSTFTFEFISPQTCTRDIMLKYSISQKYFLSKTIPFIHIKIFIFTTTQTIVRELSIKENRSNPSYNCPLHHYVSFLQQSVSQ